MGEEASTEWVSPLPWSSFDTIDQSIPLSEITRYKRWALIWAKLSFRVIRASLQSISSNRFDFWWNDLLYKSYYQFSHNFKHKYSTNYNWNPIVDWLDIQLIRRSLIADQNTYALQWLRSSTPSTEFGYSWSQWSTDRAGIRLPTQWSCATFRWLSESPALPSAPLWSTWRTSSARKTWE